ncbi:MAG TPA: hypothetical protein VEG29_05175 [Candidatus Binatia bacterium]|nr:hypothetical protein [Candidatus Binatia bacterium]
MVDADTLVALIGGVVAFLVVAGWAVVRWRAVGRDPTYTDDDSVLLAAPPPGMTAATATIIDGRPSHDALVAGLLDLASRDEIGFRDENPAASKDHPIGIEIRGGTSDDPRVRLNRRNPVGDGEGWLLTMLKETIAQRELPTGPGADRTEFQLQAVTAMAGFFGFEGHQAMLDPNAGQGGAFVGGMTGQIPDIDTFIAGIEARSGKPMSDKSRASLSRMAPMLDALRDPEAVAADPDAFIDRMAAAGGRQPTPEERAQGRAMIERFVGAHREQAGQLPPPVAAVVADPTALTGAPPGLSPAAPPAAVTPAAVTPAAAPPAPPGAPSPYLPAHQAALFHPPLGFGTFLETYAKRHGWIASMSITRRLPWRALGVVEVVVGVVVAAIASPGPNIALGVGLGIAAGGVATWLIAPAMASKTMEGAVMKAQLAAYRRTLQATFTSAGLLDDSLKPNAMTWLETPDQVLVWGVALGLRDEIVDLMRRSATAPPGPGRGAVVTDVGVFLGIEKIGTVVQQEHHGAQSAAHV